MGKLLEALKKREQALRDYKAQAAAKNGNRPPKYAEDPVNGYEYILRVNELSYQLNKAGSFLTEAFLKMPPEQRMRYFDQMLNDDRKESYARTGFGNAVYRLCRREDGGKDLQAFLENKASFGRTVPELLAGMPKIFTQEQLADMDRELRESNPNFSPTQQLAFYFSKMNQLKLDKAFDELVDPAYRSTYLHLTLERSIQRGTVGDILLNNQHYVKGKTWLDGVARLEQLMGPELAEQTASRIDGIPSPQLDPNRTVTPYAGRIQELQANLSPQDPRNSLLERVKNILVYPSEEYRQYLDQKTQNIEQKTLGVDEVPGLQVSADGYGNRAVESFLNKNLKQELLQKLPAVPSQTGYLFYDPGDVLPVHRKNHIEAGVNLQQGELQTLVQKAQGGLPDAVKTAIRDVLTGIDQLGEENYKNNEVMIQAEEFGGEPGKLLYRGEQGDKKYAFWPLVNAKKALAKAVQEGNWDQIQASTAEYERCRKITDKMMEAANRTARAPVFGSNVNSTRSEPGEGSLNPMPTEYLEDYAGHSRVNGLLLLYGAGKNSGISTDLLLDNPQKALQDYSKRFRQEKMLSAEGKSLGARLVHGFDRKLQTAAVSEWRNNMGLLERAMSAVNGMIPEEADRVDNAGRYYCAAALANYETGLESVPWQNLSSAKPEQQQAVMQLAMLLPEEEFNLRELGMKLGSKDWHKQLNPVVTIASLRQRNKLDYAAVTARSKQLLADAEAEINAKKAAGKSSPNETITAYREAALHNYYQILRTVPDDQLGTEGCKQMKAHAAELQDGLIKDRISNQKILEDRNNINEQLRTLSKRKTGYFLDTRNSPEYTAMVKQLRLLNLKLDYLAGKPFPADLNPETLEKLRNANTAELIVDAKNSCFTYASLKTKAGKSGIIHDAGKERLRCALDLYDKLGKLGDDLGIRSPAVALKDKVRLDVIRNRRSEDWETQSVENYAAGMIYSMQLQYQGVPESMQENLIKNTNTLQQRMNEIRSLPAFRKMVQNEGIRGLADRIVQGTGSLSEAYMKAVQQTAQPDIREQDIVRSSSQEKIEFWRKSDPAVGNQAPQL